MIEIENKNKEINFDKDLQEIAVSFSSTIQIKQYEPINFFASMKFQKTKNIDKEKYFDYGFETLKNTIREEIKKLRKK